MADTNEGATSAVTKTRRKASLAEMRELSPADLEARVKKTEEQLFQHKLKRYTNQLANTNLIGAAKKDIARAKTLIAQKAESSAKAADQKGTK